MTSQRMSSESLDVFLFGRLRVQQDGGSVAGLGSRKAQELLCYLLLNRERPHHRELLAETLWNDSAGTQSRKYLRQALWHVQTALQRAPAAQALNLDHDWVAIRADVGLWVDARDFEEAFERTEGIAGDSLQDTEATVLREAVALYCGDLLEGWYQDWCVFERERMKSMYLTMLEKLLGHAEAHARWEEGLQYGSRILRFDHAHERTHRRVMRLYYFSGDRTSAIRQFETCATALDRELGVRPAEPTRSLYEEIRADRGPDPPGAAPRPDARGAQSDSVDRTLDRLHRIRRTLADAQDVVTHDIEAIEAQAAANG
jgi:DNA-binding SARP family transcriptional activator